MRLVKLLEPVAERGFKPKRLRVSLRIRYADRGQLESLVRLAEATDAAGDRRVYEILNRTAKAYRIRQVLFTERLQANEQAGEQAWQVSFHLVEHHSNPERVEARRTPVPTATIETTGKPVVEPEPERELTGLEEWLQGVDGLLAPEGG
uniref:Uncharacterized protein n=1 Tax=Candidatus Kentrum sp. TUN TaxID=2126343 RepID=A0A450ZS89_9GAMM|nr:MAG: hypothetical protein BECKTUN1418F_GA0071002_10425 [Candidatus Kentron sp. TUN]VFK55277.1 MAG: hypothetical protein BECKTUN1418D_GA0071000_10308 [Candidatus Kentron sp. TUN]VFK56643.1 MAG: hypothetical protein BECKTUN1418E_GA0071001_10425 [Candidatus Kentron sp. TUN]